MEKGQISPRVSLKKRISRSFDDCCCSIIVLLLPLIGMRFMCYFLIEVFVVVIQSLSCVQLVFLGRKVMTNLDSILKNRDITLPTKVHLVKAMVFPVVMYGCESWTIKKAERQRIDAFDLWCWRRLLRVSWIARSNQSVLQEISPE